MNPIPSVGFRLSRSLSSRCQATEEEHDDKKSLLQAINAMTDVAHAINEYKRRKDLGNNPFSVLAPHWLKSSAKSVLEFWCKEPRKISCFVSFLSIRIVCVLFEVLACWIWRQTSSGPFSLLVELEFGHQITGFSLGSLLVEMRLQVLFGFPSTCSTQEESNREF